MGWFDSHSAVTRSVGQLDLHTAVSGSVGWLVLHTTITRSEVQLVYTQPSSGHLVSLFHAQLVCNKGYAGNTITVHLYRFLVCESALALS